MAQFHIGGTGPHLQVDAFGTGFLVRRYGVILTNHHVAETWWHDEELKQLIDRGADPYVLSYEAYFPGKSAALQARLDRISSKADLATLELEAPPPNRAELLELDDRKEASITGEPVVLNRLPYRRGGHSGKGESGCWRVRMSRRKLQADFKTSRIATQRLILPTTTQGHIGDVLQDQIVYDAATTTGGSGGPLLKRNGKVIGINFAVITDFGGSNLAVPARYATDLLR
jgi:serine protease Do